MPTVLTIAGYDSSEGAGITIDCKTIHALQCHALTVQTAATIQNKSGVQSITPTPMVDLTDQFNQLAWQHIAAVKIGMLVNTDIINCVSDELTQYSLPIILDPVLQASNGGALLATEARAFLQHPLMQQVTLLTPNIPETECLLNCKICNDADVQRAAHEFIAQGVSAVLIKGGHAASDNSSDYLLAANGKEEWFSTKRLDVLLRGTGCRLSTAIACYLAQGYSLPDAVREAKDFVYHFMAQYHLINEL